MNRAKLVTRARVSRTSRSRRLERYLESRLECSEIGVGSMVCPTLIAHGNTKRIYSSGHWQLEVVTGKRSTVRSDATDSDATDSQGSAFKLNTNLLQV